MESGLKGQSKTLNNKKACRRRSRASCCLCSGCDLHLTRQHEPQIILGVDRHVFGQASREVLTEVRHLAGHTLQRRDELLEFPPADTALLDLAVRASRSALVASYQFTISSYRRL